VGHNLRSGLKPGGRVLMSVPSLKAGVNERRERFFFFTDTAAAVYASDMIGWWAIT